MSGLLGKKTFTSENEISSIQFQTAVQGVPITIVYGRHRVTGNIIWYGDFTPIANTSKAGGKGGTTIVSTTYTYDVSVAIGICEGPISGYGNLYLGSTITTDAAIGLTEFLGTNPQTPWSYLSTNHPDQALSYPNLAYIARAAFQLGNSTALPNMAWEVNGFKPAISHAGVWTSRVNSADLIWGGIAWSPTLSLFVAVAESGSLLNLVMTSPDGITWTSHNAPMAANWRAVCWGNGLFVAVANTGTATTRVMTSPDGITWTLRTTPVSTFAYGIDWISVVWTGTQYVAVANGDDYHAGILDSVMTSPDGITWTKQNSAGVYTWTSVAWNGAILAAVSADGHAMSSSDGITWTLRTAASSNQWWSIAYGAGVFVATSITGTTNRVMTSPDGVNWTSRVTPNFGSWYGVCYGSGGFVAVSWDTGGNAQVMFSPDGVTAWTPAASAANLHWWAVAFGAGLFAAVAQNGTGNQVMTSGQASTLAYATLDPSQANYRIALTNSSLTASMTAAAQNWGCVKADIYSTPNAGYYYCEATIQNPVQYAVMLGLATSGALTADGYFCGIDNNGISYTSAGIVYTGNFNYGSGAAFTNGCVVGMKFNAVANTVEWLINNVHQFTFTLAPGQSFTPCVTLWCNSGTTSVTMNFGASAWTYAPGGSYTGWYGQAYAPDVTPAAVVYDLLTNTQYGALFPTTQIDSLSDWDSYCTAMGFLVSMAIDSQTPASAIVTELAQIGNGEPVWSQGILKVIPYADAAVGSYTPNTTINYALTDDAYIAPAGEDPVKITRKRQADAFNSVSVSGVDRGNSYNPATYTAQDQAAIDQYGVLNAESLTFNEICTLPVLQVVAQAILQRQLYFRNMYEFTVGWGYARLEPMDLVSLTDAGLGLSAWPVRILSVTEDSDGNLKMQAEDFFGGVTNPSTNAAQPGGGGTVNTGLPPASTGTPTIVQPPVALTGTAQIYIGAAQDPSATGSWGGCQVWASTDNVTYTQVGTITKPATFGVSTTLLNAVADPDSSSTLGLNLSASQGSLTSVPQSAADSLQTLFYLDGELLAFETATLTSAYNYNLTYLRRGAYLTADASHAIGSKFMLLDSAPLAVTYPPAWLGLTIYVKCPSFNATGGSQQSLADVPATTYTITAPATTLQNMGAGDLMAMLTSAG